MCVLPERQVNSAYFTSLIVIQVSVWQRRHFHPSGSSVTAAARAGLPRFPAPTALLPVPPLTPRCWLGRCAGLQHPVPPGACCPRASLRTRLPLPAAQPAPGTDVPEQQGRRGQAQPRQPLGLAARAWGWRHGAVGLAGPVPAALPSCWPG